MGREKKRVLIADTFFDIYFPNQEDFSAILTSRNIEVELIYAATPEEAIAALIRWRSEGHAADLLTITLEKEHNEGTEILNLVRHAAESEDIYFPGKIFILGDLERIASLGADFSQYIESGLIEEANGHEYFDLVNYAHGTPSVLCPNVDFREYLNSSFGASFPVSHGRIRTQNKNSLNPYEAAKLIKSDAQSRDVALSKLNEEEILKPDVVEATSPHHLPLEFEEGVNGARAGFLALDADTCYQLEMEGRPPIFVMNEYGVTVAPALKLIEGMVVLGYPDGHIRSVARYSGAPALMQQASTSVRIEKDEQGPKLVFPDGTVLRNGDPITIDGTRKSLYAGHLKVQSYDVSAEEREIATHADLAVQDHHGLTVLGNANSVKHIASSIKAGARGVGLFRSEQILSKMHVLTTTRLVMLSSGITRSREMIWFKAWFADEVSRALNECEKYPDFPLRLRLLDAAPREYLPDPEKDQDVIAAFSETYGITPESIESMRQENLRGPQLAKKTGYDVYKAQTEAIFECFTESNHRAVPEIMVPNVKTVEEVVEIRAIVEEIAAGRPFKFGAMIETINAVENCGAIAELCDFISFGSNDLSQEATGEREEKFSQTVMDLIRKGTESARMANPSVEISICGDQVNRDADAIRFCHDIGLDSISVAPLEKDIAFARIVAGKAAVQTPRAPRALNIKFQPDSPACNAE